MKKKNNEYKKINNKKSKEQKRKENKKTKKTENVTRVPTKPSSSRVFLSSPPSLPPSLSTPSPILLQLLDTTGFGGSGGAGGRGKRLSA